MKTTKLVALTILASTGVALFSQTAFAAETNQASELKSNGVIQFKQDRDPDPEGNSGPLRIESIAPINFGIQDISGDTKTYNSIYTEDVQEAGGQYLPLNVVTVDDRGTNEGWQLQVKETRPFSELDTDGTTVKPNGSVLTGSVITLKSATVERPLDKITEPITSRPGNATATTAVNSTGFQTLVSADANQGMGTWQTLFGEKVDAATDAGKAVENSAVTLTIPGDTAKVKDALYQAELTWILLSTPE